MAFGVQVPLQRRKQLAFLFREQKRLRTLIESILEGRLGVAYSDELESPAVAQLSLNGFTFLGGDPSTHAAETCVEHLEPFLIPPSSDDWLSLLKSVHGDDIVHRTRYGFSSTSLRLSRLRELSTAPDSISIQPIDEEIATQMWEGYGKFALHSFISPRQFQRLGIGFVAMHEGSLVAFAVSGAICARGIEIDVGTLPRFRRKGVATATAATLISHCLENGITPHWDAVSEVSSRLAVKLGFEPTGSYEVYMPYVADRA